MQREIMTSIPFLSQPSTEALNTPEDLAVAQDLKDTLDAHRNGCVGMAANMIGVSKRIIAFVDEDFGGRCLRRPRRLSVPQRRAPHGPLPAHRGDVCGSQVPRASCHIHWFHRANHPT